jgi:parvulin-like peptidyl-prolyl isomerase
VQDELVRQGAKILGIAVEAQEIDEWIKENEVPGGKAFRDIAAATMLREKLLDYFGSDLPDTMEQAHIQVMLVEGEQVANEVVARIGGGEDFAALTNDFSCNPQVVGDLGWLPRDLMPNSLIGDAVFSETASPSAPNGSGPMKLSDNSANKNIGYWLIEVTEKDEEKGVKARAILLGSRQEADEVKAELNDENFAELAKEHSQYEGGEDGGELGWLKQGDISDAFDEIAFNLELNVISEPVQDKSVQTSGGYWIVKVLEKDKNKPISDGVRQGLANNDFAEWLQTQRTISTINNYLDEEKKALAIEEVSKRR